MVRLWAGFERSAEPDERPAGTRASLIPDIQGSIIGALDSGTGTLTKTGYGAYGESPVTSGSFRYAAMRLDPEEAALYYDRARMYSTTWGRFLQTDPIGFAGGANLYTYTDNDPLNQTDPSGRCPWCIVGAVVGGGIQPAVNFIVEKTR